MRAVLISLAVIFACALFAHADDQKRIYTGLGLDDVERTIDLTKPSTVRHSVTLSIANVGDQEANSIFFTVRKDAVKNLAAIQVGSTLYSASQGFENKLNKDYLFFEHPLTTPLQKQGKTSLTAKFFFINVVTPYPEFIKQKDNQKLLFTCSALFDTPYSVKRQRTTVQLGGSPIESFSDVKPVERRGGDVVYGPYMDSKPFASLSTPLRVHFQSNFAFVVISQLERNIEISHWGNLAVEEHYVLRHAGAKLKGPFSRLDYSRNPFQFAPSSFRSIVAKLPALAQDIYYRDRIGNISTTNLKPAGDSLEVEFLPRFPMFGGWKTTFYFGYNLPISQVMTTSTSDANRLILKTLFGTPFENAPVEDLTVKIIIPEGASNFKVETPQFVVDSITYEVTKTYLDVIGRTVIVIRKKNVISEHNVAFKVSYDFARTGLLQEPLLVIGSLFAFCLMVMAYVRFDLTIYKTEQIAKRETNSRAVELIELFTEKQLEKSNLCTQVENNLNSWVNAKRLDSEMKRIHQVQESIQADIKKTVIQELVKFGMQDVASKVDAIDRKDQDKFALLERIAQLRKDNADGKLDAKRLEQQVTNLEADYNSLTATIADALDELNQQFE